MIWAQGASHMDYPKCLDQRRARSAIRFERRRNRWSTGTDEELSTLADDVSAGNNYEYAWELFRFGHFRGMDDAQSAAMLARWAREYRINVAFTTRKVRDLEIAYVRFSSADRRASPSGRLAIIRYHDANPRLHRVPGA